MRHRVAGKQLSRNTSHRAAMRRNMAASLIQHGAIRTTEVKAKELRRFVERIITIARKGTLHARRQVLAMMGDRAMANDDGEFLDKSVVQKLFDEVAPRYVDRPGGYTRIIRLSERRIGDAGRQVVLQLVEEGASSAGSSSGSSSRKRRSARRHAAAAAVAEQTPPDGQADAQVSAEQPAPEELPRDDEQAKE